ncbi:MAG TPA: hydrogenase nickel incorporation protein HypB [Candidatus Acidoferrales bacterium]|nr:hydrogenase nickel incorporation protein HypB [Candidatus Acidoferrales bacterium]
MVAVDIRLAKPVEVVTSAEGEVFDVELEVNILRENERLAEENKSRLHSKGVHAVDVMGSVGSGKTSLIKSMISQLKKDLRIAVIEGDVTTTIDSDIISSEGVPTVQVNTGKECHLDANLIRKALDRIPIDRLDLIFIENVGNLICPAEFPLGSDRRLVVISVTEGPYMVVKHPMMFLGAKVVAINKIDVAAAMGVDPNKLSADVARLNPKAATVHTSCRNGTGIKEVIEKLELKNR